MVRSSPICKLIWCWIKSSLTLPKACPMSSRTAPLFEAASNFLLVLSFSLSFFPIPSFLFNQLLNMFYSLLFLFLLQGHTKEVHCLLQLSGDNYYYLYLYHLSKIFFKSLCIRGYRLLQAFFFLRCWRSDPGLHTMLGKCSTPEIDSYPKHCLK